MYTRRSSGSWIPLRGTWMGATLREAQQQAAETMAAAEE